MGYMRLLHGICISNRLTHMFFPDGDSNGIINKSMGFILGILSDFIGFGTKKGDLSRHF